MLMKNKMSNQIRHKTGLVRKRDNHFRTDDKEYEYMARESFELHISIAELARTRLFPAKWEARLSVLRELQKLAGFPEDMFMHPQMRKVIAGAKNGHN